MYRVLVAVFFISVSVAACKRDSSSQQAPAAKPQGETTMSMTLTSSVFREGEAIPKKYTCDGEDVSPALAWSGVPNGTKSIALICDDPDAPSGTWVHWVLWGLPPEATSLPEGVRAGTPLPGGARQGLNSWRKIGYGGPCPPPGKPHRYYFKLYALDAPLNPPGTADKAGLEAAMTGHILGQGQLMGRYGRQG